MKYKALVYRSSILIWCMSVFVACTPEKLISGYEILAIPQSPSTYKPGRLWVHKVGPIGHPLGKTRTDFGPESLTSEERHSIEIGIKGGIINWISTSMGISSKKIRHVHLRRLHFSQVEDLYEIGARGELLYETITAEGIQIHLIEGERVNLFTDQTSASKMEFEATGTDGRTFSVHGQNGTPLVVAVKIVSLSYSDPERASAELDSGRVGIPIEIGLGYTAELLPEPSPRPAEGIATIRFNNPQLVQFSGASAVISAESPWINPVRFPTNADNDEFIWDKIDMAWSGTKIRLFVTRQTLTVKVKESGL